MKYPVSVGRRIIGIACLSGMSFQWAVVSMGRCISGISCTSEMSSQWDAVSVNCLASLGHLHGMSSQWDIEILSQWIISSQWNIVSMEFVVPEGDRLSGMSCQWNVVSVECRLSEMSSLWDVVLVEYRLRGVSGMSTQCLDVVLMASSPQWPVAVCQSCHWNLSQWN